MTEHKCRISEKITDTPDFILCEVIIMKRKKKDKYVRQLLSFLLCLIILSGLAPSIHVHAWDNVIECEYCGAVCGDDYICDGGDHCGIESGRSCYEEHHCSECGACDNAGEFCENCGMCVDCAIDAGTHCPECETCESEKTLCMVCNRCADCGGECSAGIENCDVCLECYISDNMACEVCGECFASGDSDWCPGCGLCAECAGEWCDSCEMCVSCALDEEKHCPDCGTCTAEEGCVICHRCFDCGGRCSNECADACLECHLDNDAACPECGACFMEDDENRCPICGLCSECADNWCEDCKMCQNCAVAEQCHCPDCGDCLVDAGNFCEGCNRCPNCFDEWCSECELCVECATNDGKHCPDCETCTVDEGCMLCHRCFDCGGQCSNDCADACLECHLDNNAACPDCGACFALGDENQCPICGLCSECADNWCEDCKMCQDCAVAEQCHCPDCGGCLVDAGDFCEGCNRCHNCFDEWCSECELCVECATNDGKHCPDCGACTVDEGCMLCHRCFDCGGECGDSCADACLECHFDNNVACPGCGACFISDDSNQCLSCGYCSECVSEWCDDCQMCVDCAISDGKHCQECEACYAGAEHICSDCGRCSNCFDEWCDDCNLCTDCAMNDGKHCPDCSQCYSEAESYCEGCGKCSDCTNAHCPDCKMCDSCVPLCGNCHYCEEDANICPDCGAACSECSPVCGNCGLCENCATICVDCVDHCSDCSIICEGCNTCEECADICEGCGEVCSSCGDICASCKLCEKCCKENSKLAGCDHGICIMSDGWDTHWSEEHTSGEHGHVYIGYLYNEIGHWQTCKVGSCDEKTLPQGHSFGEWYSVKEATESETGLNERVCAICSYKETETIPVILHIHKLTFVPEKEVTCTEDGNIAYYTCTCGKWFTDEAAKEEITDKTSVILSAGHTVSSWKLDENKHWRECVASGCGMVLEETKANHEYGTDNICDICGYDKSALYTIIEGKNGKWVKKTEEKLVFRASGLLSKFKGIKVDGDLVDESKYTAVSGSTVVTLEKEYLDTLAIGVHELTFVYNDGEVSTYFSILSSEADNPDHVHTLTLVAERNAFCTADGNKEYYTCTCGKRFTGKDGTEEITDYNSIVIPATGHDYRWILDKAATDTESGSKHLECRYCLDAKEAVEIPVSYVHTHNFVWMVDKEATRKSTGLQHEECSTCGEKRNENTVIGKLTDGGKHKSHSHKEDNSTTVVNNVTVTGTGTDGTAPDIVTSPKTGDTYNAEGWILLLLTCSTALTGFWFIKKRKASN